MFVELFAASFVLALTLSVTIAWLSRETIDVILRRFIVDAVVRAGFVKYIRFAIVVVGTSGGTRVQPLQEYISAADYNKPALLAAVLRMLKIEPAKLSSEPQKPREPERRVVTLR